MAEASKTPKGVLAILTDHAGYVWATATDFETSRPGGFTTRSAQEYRARRKLSLAFIQSVIPQAVLPAFESYDAEQVITRLCRRTKDGWRVTLTAIGYEDA